MNMRSFVNPRTLGTYIMLALVEGFHARELMQVTTTVKANRHEDPPFVVGRRGKVVCTNVLKPDGEIVATTVTIDENGNAWVPTNWL
jgi:hypothetical protein